MENTEVENTEAKTYYEINEEKRKEILEREKAEREEREKFKNVVVPPKQLRSTGRIHLLPIDDVKLCPDINIRMPDEDHARQISKASKDTNIADKPTLVIWNSKINKYCVVDGQHIKLKADEQKKPQILCEILDGDSASPEIALLARDMSALRNINKELSPADKLNDVFCKRQYYDKYIKPEKKIGFKEWYLKFHNSVMIKEGTFNNLSAWAEKMNIVDKTHYQNKTVLEQVVEMDLKWGDIKKLGGSKSEEEMLETMNTIRSIPAKNRNLRKYIENSPDNKVYVSVHSVSYEALKGTEIIKKLNGLYRNFMDSVLVSKQKNNLTDEELVARLDDIEHTGVIKISEPLHDNDEE